MQSSHSLLTFPLHPLSMQLQAIHFSSLVISCLSLHPQQQIFPRASSYQLLKPSHFPVRQEYKPVSYFVHKSVLQVTSSNLRIQHTCHVAASNCPLPPLTSSLFRHLSVWHVRSFVDTSFVGDHSFPRIKQSLLRRLSF